MKHEQQQGELSIEHIFEIGQQMQDEGADGPGIAISLKESGVSAEETQEVLTKLGYLAGPSADKKGLSVSIDVELGKGAVHPRVQIIDWNQ